MGSLYINNYQKEEIFNRFNDAHYNEFTHSSRVCEGSITNHCIFDIKEHPDCMFCRRDADVV